MPSITLKKRAGKKHIHHSSSDRVLPTVIPICLVVFFIIVAYPVLDVLVCSGRNGKSGLPSAFRTGSGRMMSRAHGGGCAYVQKSSVCLRISSVGVTVAS